jgi:hypothetical protein
VCAHSEFSSNKDRHKKQGVGDESDGEKQFIQEVGIV